MSTAYHPQTDGQTEQIYHVTESYLRYHYNYEHSDWASMLAMAEYAYNSSKHSSTNISPFYANYGFKPRMNWPTEIQFKNPASELYGHYMNEVHRKLKKRLNEAEERMRKHYDRKRKSIQALKKTELGMRNGRNIRANHRCKKLDVKMLGPLEVVSVWSNLRYCKLTLPDSWKMLSLSNINLLQSYTSTDVEKQEIEIEADGNDWVMESIIARGPLDDNPQHHVFLGKWKVSTQEENMWETFENVAESTLTLLEEYYKKNPTTERDGRFTGRKKSKVSKKK